MRTNKPAIDDGAREYQVIPHDEIDMWVLSDPGYGMSGGYTRYPLLMDVDPRGVMTPEQVQLHEESRLRITELLDGITEDDRTVRDIIARERTPGTLAAMLLCEQYLACGGSMGNLFATTCMLLPARVNPKRITRENVGSVGRLCLTLQLSRCQVADVVGVLKIALEDSDLCHFVESVVSQRGIMDPVVIERLVTSRDNVEPSLQEGTL